MAYSLTPGHPTTAGAELVNIEVATVSTVGACAPRTAPFPAALDPVSAIVSDIFRGLAPRFCGTTFEGSGKKFDGAAALPKVDIKLMGVDVHGGGIVGAENMNFRFK
ncbi:hypothetical protein [Nocardia sp. NBC_01009]|uniref:hypothetical protein n=1 Tax=Nocardia sp. NBC_01009 TaxID=2975996 RepID=UPI003863C2DA|nr:hypothetical protein OHA42_32610 [Nocardia sp. NBC_01009]